MIITETNIPDVTYETLDQSKLSLANGIINNVYPLFDEVYTSKNDQVDELKGQITSNNKKLKAEKQTIEKTMIEYKRQKRVSKLLQRLEKLVSSGLVYDGTLKHETVILLKILPKLSNEQIDDHLRKTLQVIKKRFAK
jgi:hypothetical protein